MTAYPPEQVRVFCDGGKSVLIAYWDENAVVKPTATAFYKDDFAQVELDNLTAYVGDKVEGVDVYQLPNGKFLCINPSEIGSEMAWVEDETS